MAIILIISMMDLTSCLSSPQPEIKTIYVCPDIYFPNFPKPRNIIPLDSDGKKVVDDETEIMNVLIPYWYWNLIIDYKLEVDDAENYYKAYKSKLND